jgi:3-oxoacyl-[acyl-carrier protein] reductase
MLLLGKNAVITGCSRGIGRRLLQAFAENGSNVYACCRAQSPEFEAFASELAKINGVKISPLYFDLADTNKMKEAIKKIIAEKAPLDVLVNNAGITYNALFQMTSMETMREVFEVNFFAPMIFSQYIVKLMVRQKSGSIINISSSAALDANPGRGAYGASKAALICMTRTMAHELAGFNVRANIVAPGITDTEMVSASMSEVAIQEALRQTRLKRIGKPSETADAVVFLASDYSTYVTGQILRVDGGLQN